MTKQSETVVFFGSGPVAAKSLELLVQHTPVEAVVTKPKPAHHKEAFPVIEVAEKLGLPILPVTDTESLDELFAGKPVTSRLGVLIDFGIIANPLVMDYFPLGIINSHFSVLPEWRGADPISFSILSGQKTTGVSIMLLVPELDEGPLLSYGEEPLDGTETTPSLTERLIRLSDGLLQHDLPRYLNGEIDGGMPQLSTGREVSYSRKLMKEDGILDFAKSAEVLEREIRAFIEWPKSRANIGDKSIIITKAHVVNGNGNPGKIWKDGKQFGFYTTSGILAIDELKPAGKQAMSAEAFLSGYKLE